MRSTANPMNRLNLATALHGLAGGFLLSHVTLVFNQRSLILAAIFNACYALASSFSRFAKKFRIVYLNLATLFLRVLILILVGFRYDTRLIIFSLALSLILASFSRRQFIDLKQEVGGLDVRTLTTHGSFNAIGYGIGSGLAGLLLESNSWLMVSGVISFLLAYLLYPKTQINLERGKGVGLSKRDVAVAILFTAAISPLGNAMALIILPKLYSEKIAALAVLSYTFGSLLSQFLADKLRKTSRPIAKSLSIASLLFLFSLLYINPYLLIIIRIVIGSLLYAGQGLLEERTHKETESEKDLDYLWSIFSLTGSTLFMILPLIGERFGFYYLPLYSLFLALIIGQLRRILP